MGSDANVENRSASSGAAVAPANEPVPPRMPRGLVTFKPEAKPELKPRPPTRRVFVGKADVPVRAEEPKESVEQKEKGSDDVEQAKDPHALDAGYGHEPDDSTSTSGTGSTRRKSDATPKDSTRRSRSRSRSRKPKGSRWTSDDGDETEDLMKKSNDMTPTLVEYG